MTDQAEPYVTPAVRKLAEQHGVPLNYVIGSGAGGRITTSDVRAWARWRESARAPESAAASQGPKRGEIVASYPGAVAASTDAALPPFTASGVDPRELLKLPPPMRATAAAATDPGTVLAMIQQAAAADARGGVVSVDDGDTSWINDVWPT